MTKSEQLVKTLSIIIIFCFYGCQHNQKKENSFRAKISADKSKTKKILLDSLTSSSANNIAYFSDRNGKSLFLLNLLNNRIETYDWDTGKLTSKLKLEKEGPNGVGNATAFYVQNRDSIYIISGNQFKISLIDSKGKIKNKFSILKNSDQKKEVLGEGVVIYGDEANNIKIINNHLYSCASPFDDPAIERYYSQGQYGLDLNLQTGRVNTIINAPTPWKQKFSNGYRLTNQQNFYGQDYNEKKGTCIISFMTENEIYEVDLKTKKITEHEAKSESINKIEWITRSSNVLDPSKELDFFIQNKFYPSIYYDKYRDIYLRFAAHPNKNKKDRSDDHPLVVFSIIILDKNFNKIGEDWLDEKYTSNSLIINNNSIFIKEKTNNENELLLTPLTFSIN